MRVTGFLELAQFEAICAHLPADLQPPVRFAYLTGLRFKSEVLPLTADRVDLGTGHRSAEPRRDQERPRAHARAHRRPAKDPDRAIASLAALEQWGIVSGAGCFTGRTAPGIHDGKKKGLESGDRALAGYPQALVHDFRRSAVRNARTLRRGTVNRHGDGRTRNGVHLPPVCHSGRSDVAGGGRAQRCVCRRAEGAREACPPWGRTASVQAAEKARE